MRVAPTSRGLLIRTQPGGAFTFAAAARADLGLELEPLFPNAAVTRPNPGSGSVLGEWLLAPAQPSCAENAWDVAHQVLDRLGFADGSAYVEPDFLQQFPVLPREPVAHSEAVPENAPASTGSSCVELLPAPAAGVIARILHVHAGDGSEHALGAVPLNDFARDFDDGHETKRSNHFIGAPEHAELIPVRIETSQALFRTSALARALDHALGAYDGPDRDHPGTILPPVDVAMLSVGGLASAAWADAANAAYEAGICIVAGSGNTFTLGTSSELTRLIVYPARFRRAIAASRVSPDLCTALRREQMQAGTAPSRTASALAALTAEMPWPELGAPDLPLQGGAATCGAIAQVAAAAALWIAKHRGELDRYAERWQRVEAVRHALFTSADVFSQHADRERLGKAILRATRALTLAPRARLAMTPDDQPSLPLLRMLTGDGMRAGPGRRSMLAVEATQLTQLLLQEGSLEGALSDPDAPASWVPPADALRIAEALLADHRPSAPLRVALERARAELCASRIIPPTASTPPASSPPPSAARSSPYGRDPAAALTIGHFESALGRSALWSGDLGRSGPEDHRSSVLPGLLFHPRALGLAVSDASSLGLLPVTDPPAAERVAEALAQRCLSRDAVVHESARALLREMHGTSTCPANPDAVAFDEAFADVVSLLQHFTYRDLIRDEIRRARGMLRSQESLFSALATELGRGTGRRGELRDHIGKRDPETGNWRPDLPRPGEGVQAQDAHARGAVLVAAIFDAFLSIYERRTRNLVRLSTAGPGAASDPAHHPHLVERLASEAARTARHVLRMCIRALDYCPPVDLTFGEFLRALITADRDLVPDDDLGYRLAFIVAFRHRSIHPENVRILSEQSLSWRGLGTSFPSRKLMLAIASALAQVRDGDPGSTRVELIGAGEALKHDLHAALVTVFQDRAHGARDAALLGLALERSSDRFDVEAVRFVDRVGPGGRRMPQCILRLLQRAMRPLDPTRPEAESTAFEGGSTVILDVGREGGASDLERRVAIRYVIRKSIGSRARLERQIRYRSALRAEAFLEAPPAAAGAARPNGV